MGHTPPELREDHSHHAVGKPTRFQFALERGQPVQFCEAATMPLQLLVVRVEAAKLDAVDACAEVRLYQRRDGGEGCSQPISAKGLPRAEVARGGAHLVG